MVDRVPAEEWAQIFDEVWRRYRDFFYVENMHGYDWEALARRSTAPLLAHVAHRSDLNYVIGEMIAELNVGSTPTSPAATSTLPPRAAGRACPAPASSSTRRPAATGSRSILRGPERGGALPLAADRDRRRRQGGRLRAGDRRRGAAARTTIRTACCATRPTGPVTLTLNATPTRRRARARSRSSRSTSEDEPDLPRLGARRTARASPSCPSGRVGYLHMPGHGRRRHPRVHQVVLRRRSARRAWSSTSAPTAAATSRGC